MSGPGRARGGRVVAVAAIATLLVAAGRRDYVTSYKDHTRELILYNGFQTALILRATSLDGDFRSALAAERRRLLNAPEDDHREFLSTMAEDGAIYHEIVFSADSGMEDAREFGTEEGWLLRLYADGQAEDLVTVYRVKDPTPLHRALYPHLNRWSDLWIARFTRNVDAPSTLELQVAGGYGHGEVTWARHP